MLAIVPARGGSKGIPNKNLRLLHGKPLLLHILDTLRCVPDVTLIAVSTDSPEIAAVARLHGYKVVDRPADLATDDMPLGPVVEHAVRELEWDFEVGVFQPTVPCLSAETIWDAIRRFRSEDWHSLGFVTREPHLLWNDDGPLYSERVNRQENTDTYRELGAFLTLGVPVGDFDPIVSNRHCRYLVPDSEAVDIDTHADLIAAERLMGRRTIEFRTTVGEQIGTGHLRRCLALAEELSHHRIQFRWTPGWPLWAYEQVASRGWLYTTTECLPPDMVLFDRLDTTVEEVCKAKAEGVPVVTLEDLGAGSEYADLVINELYDDPRKHVLSGPRWAVLRPEFVGLPGFHVREEPRRVLVVFGGTDPSRLAERVMPLTPLAVGVDGTVAESMRAADLVVTSAGRMAHEAAAVGVPCITIAANERESRHSHCPGILRLGLGALVSDDQIREAVTQVLRAPALREEMSATARAAVDGKGARRIGRLIDDLLEGL